MDVVQMVVASSSPFCKQEAVCRWPGGGGHHGNQRRSNAGRRSTRYANEPADNKAEQRKKVTFVHRIKSPFRLGKTR